MAHRHDALACLGADMRAGDADEGADNLEARLLLGLADRADNGLDDFLGIDDHRLFQTARGHDPDPDDFEVVVLRHFGNQRTDLGCAHINADDDPIVAHRKYGRSPNRTSITSARLFVRVSSSRIERSEATWSSTLPPPSKRARQPSRVGTSSPKSR